MPADPNNDAFVAEDRDLKTQYKDFIGSRKSTLELHKHTAGRLRPLFFLDNYVNENSNSLTIFQFLQIFDYLIENLKTVDKTFSKALFEKLIESLEFSNMILANLWRVLARVNPDDEMSKQIVAYLKMQKKEFLQQAFADAFTRGNAATMSMAWQCLNNLGAVDFQLASEIYQHVETQRKFNLIQLMQSVPSDVKQNIWTSQEEREQSAKSKPLGQLFTKLIQDNQNFAFTFLSDQNAYYSNSNKKFYINNYKIASLVNPTAYSSFKSSIDEKSKSWVEKVKPTKEDLQAKGFSLAALKAGAKSLAYSFFSLFVLKIKPNQFANALSTAFSENQAPSIEEDVAAQLREEQEKRLKEERVKEEREKVEQVKAERQQKRDKRSETRLEKRARREERKQKKAELEANARAVKAKQEEVLKPITALEDRLDKLEAELEKKRLAEEAQKAEQQRLLEEQAQFEEISKKISLVEERTGVVELKWREKVQQEVREREEQEVRNAEENERSRIAREKQLAEIISQERERVAQEQKTREKLELNYEEEQNEIPPHLGEEDIDDIRASNAKLNSELEISSQSDKSESDRDEDFEFREINPDLSQPEEQAAEPTTSTTQIIFRLKTPLPSPAPRTPVGILNSAPGTPGGIFQSAPGTPGGIMPNSAPPTPGNILPTDISTPDGILPSSIPHTPNGILPTDDVPVTPPGILPTSGQGKPPVAFYNVFVDNGQTKQQAFVGVTATNATMFNVGKSNRPEESEPVIIEAVAVTPPISPVVVVYST